jgi:hypothetical protein
MGQTIEILDSVVVSDLLLLTTDRTLTGQDGESYMPPFVSEEGATFGARLAERLLSESLAIDHVYVMSNAISLRRLRGWDETSSAAAREVVSSFFRFYR